MPESTCCYFCHRFVVPGHVDACAIGFSQLSLAGKTVLYLEYAHRACLERAAAWYVGVEPPPNPREKARHA
ncbi:MAG: hypothetical protein ABSF62_02485 [Bryobacteraceae bacterium]